MEYELWHGTNQDVPRFDPAYLGSHTDNAASREAFFLAADRRTAEDYAHSAARKMIPDQAAHEAKIAELIRRADEAAGQGRHAVSEKLFLEAEELEGAALNAPPAGATVLHCRVRIDNPLEIEMAGGCVLPDLGTMIRAAREEGYDALILRNINDTPSGLGPVDDHFVIFDADSIEIIDRITLDPQDLPQP